MRKYTFRWLAAFVGLTALLLGAFVSPASAAGDGDDGNDYWSQYGDTTQDAELCLTCGTTTGSDLVRKSYVLTTIDTNGNVHVLRLWRVDRYMWKYIPEDGQMLIRGDTDDGVLTRDGANYYGLYAHNSNMQPRLFPFLSGSSNNVPGANRVRDWSDVNPRYYHTNSWSVASHGWQNSDTRWLHNTSKWTIKLSNGEKFWNNNGNCGCGSNGPDGKTTFTLTTVTDYQR